MLGKIKESIKLFAFKKKWKRRNKHNFTNPISIFPIERVNVGKNTYGWLDVETYGNDNAMLKIGMYCSIARDVRFVLDGEHAYKVISTYPFKVRIAGEKSEVLSKGPIILEDDVWIGERSTILSGVTIGQGAIVAAGSIVYKNIPPYAIYANGEIIKYRFSNEIIKKLLTLNYNKLDNDKILANIKYLYEEVTENNIDRIIKIINGGS